MVFNNAIYTVNIRYILKSIVEDLDAVTQRFIIYLPLVFFIFGFIGFIGNTFTYLQAELRSSTCCIYSLCGSFIDIINLSLYSFPSYLSIKHGINIPWYISSASCKLNLFLLVFLPHLSVNFLLMAIIDRFASTCSFTSPIRRLNQVRMVPYMIVIIIITSCLASIYAPILFDFMFELYCISTQPIITSTLYICLIGLMQPILMLIFVLLTYRNVRRSRRRVGEGVRTNGRHPRNQFIVMICCQVLVTGFLSLQWIIAYIYYTITSDQQKTFEQSSVIWFVFSLTNACYYINNVKSFYLSILTSRLFCTTFKKAITQLLFRSIRAQFHIFQINVSRVTNTNIRLGDITRH